MTSFMRIVRNLTYTSYRQISFANRISVFPKCQRSLHCSSSLFGKMFKERENSHAYGILENKGIAASLSTDMITSPSLSEDEFQTLMLTDWSKKSRTEIYETFPKLAVYCSEHNMCISNKIFDDYIDHLTDNLKYASDDELKTIFYTLNKFPDPESVRTRNYIEVWVALDDECLKRSQNWSYDQILSFVALMYMLNVTRISDFSHKALNKLATRAKNLTPGQLVQALFFIGVWRKSPFDMHNLEIQLKNIFSEFSIDDLAIMSMGFFKSKTPIRDMDLVLSIIDAIIANVKDIHEVSLAALLKLIRYSTRVSLDDRIYRLLDALQHEVPKLSVMCNVHIALLGTTTMHLHEDCLLKIANTVVNNISKTRIKDLERLVLTYGTFNLVPQTKDCFFTKVIDELRKPERMEEINYHGRSYACCLAYLSLLNFYPEDLINKVLSPEFLENAYGKYCYNYGREILMLNYIADIFCSNAVVNRLPVKDAKILAKKYTDYVPSEDHPKQYNVTEKMVLDVIRNLREMRGGKQYVIGDHILPHYQRGDIIICDDPSGAPVDIESAFPTKDFGLLRRPPNDNVWTVLVIAGKNAIIHNTDTATGFFISKIKELKAIGYNATLVPWSIYSKIESTQEKAYYLKQLIENCKKNKS
ncbi:FAST kinase domain-containing protein 5, mitochondrial [Anticarsia gemmatalis]|uniref:FAST kinase domain-containing protein 5, mitochondrial n=1 Tax=Anticarsia gemmatalis TaxID=129554 RepID=UPI003F777923